MISYLKVLFLVIALILCGQTISGILFEPILKAQNLSYITFDRLSSSISSLTTLLLLIPFFLYYYRRYIIIGKVTLKKTLLYFVLGISIKTILFFTLILIFMFYYSPILLTPETYQEILEIYREISEISIKDSIQNFNISYDYLIFFFTAVIIVPILEELLFRGFMLEYLLNKGKSKVWAIIFISVVFGLMHVGRNGWDGSVFNGIFSIIACLIYLRERNLVYPIIAHFSSNFIALVILIFPIFPNEVENSLHESFKCNINKTAI